MNNLSFQEKIKLINESKYLDTLISDENEIIRASIADKGYGLDILINDKDEMVRNHVIRYCKRHKHIPLCNKIFTRHHILNLLYASKIDFIKKCKHLDILVEDEDPAIRRAIAEHGYYLEKLINDINPGVRMQVVRQGYGLETLICDNDNWVRGAVIQYCRFSNKKEHKDLLKLYNL